MSSLPVSPHPTRFDTPDAERPSPLRAVAPAPPGLAQRIDALRSALPQLAAALGPAALALVYVWFGALKVFGMSPATELVVALQVKTLPMLGSHFTVVALGLFEVAVGVALLSERHRLLALAVVLLHMGATALPLVLLPELAWQGAFVPTLEGQYILKNVVLVALAAGIVAASLPQPEGDEA